MKAKFEDIQKKSGNGGLLAYRFTVPVFKFNWHYHPEFELTLIVRGTGTRLVGDNFGNFDDGDLALIGPKVPHTWATGPAARSKQSAVVVQFTREFIEPFIRLPEFTSIGRLLTQSQRGIQFKVMPGDALVEKIKQLCSKKGVEKIAHLFLVLEILSHKKFLPLASDHVEHFPGRDSERRINTVCHYVERESSGVISVKKAADLIHLSESAFCKFFKRQMGKTFSDYVNHIRISEACRLLLNSDMPIGEIAFQSGFESLSYFNRTFLKKKGVRPKDFRKKNSVAYANGQTRSWQR